MASHVISLAGSAPADGGGGGGGGGGGFGFSPTIHDAVPVSVLLHPNCPAGHVPQFCKKSIVNSTVHEVVPISITTNFMNFVVTLLANCKILFEFENMLSGKKFPIDVYKILSCEIKTSNSFTYDACPFLKRELNTNPHIVVSVPKLTTINSFGI